MKKNELNPQPELPKPSALASVSGCAALVYLDEWFGKQCDRDWEHLNGIKLETTDNPGWWLEIDLDGTSHYDLAVKMRNEVWEIEAMDRKLCAYADQAYLADMLIQVVAILAQHNASS